MQVTVSYNPKVFVINQSKTGWLTGLYSIPRRSTETIVVSILASTGSATAFCISATAVRYIFCALYIKVFRPGLLEKAAKAAAESAAHRGDCGAASK